jgi:branched-chain amino acid aminotransferase
VKIEIRKVSQSHLSEVNFNAIEFGKVYSDHMFVADFKDGEWGNFSIQPYEDLKLAPGNCTLHYGQSVFEGLKAYRTADDQILVFRPYDNLKRMNKSSERMCMPEIPEEVFIDGLRELVKIDKDWVPGIEGTSLYIRPFMIAMDEYIGIRPSDTYKFIIFTCPVVAYYSEPVKVKIEQRYVRASKGGLGFAKVAGNYAASLYPAKLAHEQGYQQLIWTDCHEHKYIEESGTMNLMFILNDKLITPVTGETILNGITRDSIITLSKELGMEVEERDISIDELIEGLENGSLKDAFGTGTAATIAHIKTIGYNGKDYSLPPISSRDFSNRILDTLEKLKRGEIEDKYNWLLHI